MSDLRLLYLCPAGLHCARWRKGALTPEGFFPAGPDGPAALARHLAAQPRSDHRTRHLLLVDLPDETFHLETLPRLHGGDRRRLITRRQAQLHLDTPYIAQRSLGQAPAQGGTPGQERVLFAALTRPSALAPWLDTLRDSTFRLSGIHSAALLAEAIGATLAPLPPTALVACFSPAGLRISCLDQGKVCFSRLVPQLQAGSPRPWDAVNDEIQRTHQYLLGQRALDRGPATAVFILAAGDAHGALASACPDTPELRVIAIDLPRLAADFGLRTPADSTDALPLLLHLTACTRRQLQFLPAAERRQRTLARAGLALGLGAALLSSASLVLAARGFLDTRQLEAQVAALNAATEAEEAHSRALSAATTVLPAPLDTVQALLTRLAARQRTSAGPAPFLHQLAHLLDKHPAIALRGLEWSAGSDDTPREQIRLAIAAGGSPAPFVAALRRVPGIEIDGDTADSVIVGGARPVTEMPARLDIRLSLPAAAP